jgi:hypothetical protein
VYIRGTVCGEFHFQCVRKHANEYNYSKYQRLLTTKKLECSVGRELIIFWYWIIKATIRVQVVNFSLTVVQYISKTIEMTKKKVWNIIDFEDFTFYNMDSWTLDSGTLSGLMTLDSGRSYIKYLVICHKV